MRPLLMGPRGADTAELVGPDFGLGCRGVRPLPEHCQNSVHVHDAWLPICMCMFHNLFIFMTCVYTLLCT